MRATYSRARARAPRGGPGCRVSPARRRERRHAPAILGPDETGDLLDGTADLLFGHEALGSAQPDLYPFLRIAAILVGDLPVGDAHDVVGQRGDGVRSDRGLGLDQRLLRDDRPVRVRIHVARPLGEQIGRAQLAWPVL